MAKKHPYRCLICQCYLDPGDGLICDECREEIRQAEESRTKMRAGSVIPARNPIPGAELVEGFCPYCGQGFEFQCIVQPEDDLLEKWAIQKCDCLEAQMERLFEADRRQERRRNSEDGTY